MHDKISRVIFFIAKLTKWGVAPFGFIKGYDWALVDGKVASAVLCPGFFIMAGVYGTFFAITDTA